jgi:uncharacterized membrane protein YphA (DoxX/SURF4 family)
MNTIRLLAAILLTTMFFLSGFHKIITYTKTVDNFRGKININVNEQIYHLVILLVILLEILAPVIIVYHYITEEYSSYSNYAVISLIVFTILATLLYHPLDMTNYYKSIPFWANISLIGGLLLLIKENV